MDKQEYLKVREQLVIGNINDQGIELLYDFWCKNKKHEYTDLTQDEFKVQFINFLNSGVVQLNLGSIIGYYDAEHVITTVKDNKDNVLTLY